MKKIAICLSLLFWALASMTASAQEYPRGDVDSNGRVGISDVTYLIDYLLNKSADAQEEARCDVDRDGGVGISDVTCLIDYVLNGAWPDVPVDHEWVDLGLPSGTLWATCNVGADSPEEYGDYFAWGETEPKEYYLWNNYKWCNGWEEALTKYCFDSNYGDNGFTDDMTELEPEDDAATVNWGSSWRMPTAEQLRELCEKCSFVSTEVNGVTGHLFTGPNGNTLFLPAAGDRIDQAYLGTGQSGFYWSRMLSSGSTLNVAFLNLYLEYSNMTSNPRFFGLSVRAVRVSQD